MNRVDKNYHDRKMAKWQGFVLSDHAELMQESAKIKTKLNLQREKQTSEIISETISQAFLTKKQLLIQMEFLSNGLYEDDLMGIVVGQEENNLYLQTHSELIIIESALIRYAEICESRKWWDSHS